MDLNDITLEEWFKEQDVKKFPMGGKIDYISQYKGIKDYLVTYVYRDVTAYASRDGGYLTDHGADHVETVIQRASKLLNSPKFDLTPYETYMLLVAILIHDAGHIEAGRQFHEKNAAKVVLKLGSKLGNEDTEKRHILNIVDAHGGSISGNKDKITPLEEEAMSIHFPVRLRLLASILRFADELSEDRSRTSRYLLENNSIPKRSEVYHHYSDSLHSVKVDLEGKVISLYFELNKEKILRKLGKDDKETYLLEEIYERTLKTYIECLYCMRFMPLEIQIKAIKVYIKFFDKLDNADPEASYHEFITPIIYTLTEIGYPDFSNRNIFEMCPNELKIDGDNLTGDKLKELIGKKQIGRRE